MFKVGQIYQFVRKWRNDIVIFPTPPPWNKIPFIERKNRIKDGDNFLILEKISISYSLVGCKILFNGKIGWIEVDVPFGKVEFKSIGLSKNE